MNQIISISLGWQIPWLAIDLVVRGTIFLDVLWQKLSQAHTPDSNAASNWHNLGDFVI